MGYFDMGQLVIKIAIALVVIVIGIFVAYPLLSNDDDTSSRFVKGTAQKIVEPILGDDVRLDVDSSKTTTKDYNCEVLYLLSKEYEDTDLVMIPAGSVLIPIYSSNQVTDYYVVAENEDGVYRFRIDELDWKMLKEGDTISIQPSLWNR